MKKKCPSCLLEMELNKFHSQFVYCLACHNLKSKKWRENNKEKWKESLAKSKKKTSAPGYEKRTPKPRKEWKPRTVGSQHRKRAREFLRKVKETAKCQTCGSVDYNNLHFHHLRDKVAPVSHMAKWGYKIETIQHEIDKCIILCASCHTTLHQELRRKEKMENDMASANKKVKVEIRTAGGAVSIPINVKRQLERSVMSCMLFEDTFYENGTSIYERIKELVSQNDFDDVVEIALRAKNDMRLRHVPLLLARELFRNKDRRKSAGELLYKLVTRPDDITEWLALYWLQNKEEPLAKQAKVALGKAFHKFDEYQLQKWNGGSKAIKLVDALRIVHPEKSELLGKLRRNELKTPDTWEVELSKGGDKKVSWNRLLTEGKLGGLAFLRNIRNMREAGVDKRAIQAGISIINPGKLLPVNFISAAKHNPEYENEIEQKFFDSFAKQQKLTGKTILIVDISGSMRASLSAKSELTRLDVAGSLAMITRECCEESVIYLTAGDDRAIIHATALIPARRGFALSDYVKSGEANGRLGSGGIFLVQCMEYVKKEQKNADRIIVLTDEQDCDNKLKPEGADAFGTYNYLINISAEKNGIGYRKWTHIDGWSDRCIDYIMEYEKGVNKWQQCPSV